MDCGVVWERSQCPHGLSVGSYLLVVSVVHLDLGPSLSRYGETDVIPFVGLHLDVGFF